VSFSITAACIGCTACAKACPVSAIAGERKLLHRIDPSRCIECGACGRVCPSGAVLNAAGVVVQRLPRGAWPKPRFDLDRCIACGVCEAKCPARCIVMTNAAAGEGAEIAASGLAPAAPAPAAVAGDWKPRLENPEACVSCGWCAFYCPVSCIVVAAPAAEEANA
jgi:formate hydrogenlyase subunit 6/NADH:ubiquinone oxidoreductase subunit I